MGLENAPTFAEIHSASQALIDYFDDNGLSLSPEQQRCVSGAFGQGLTMLTENRVKYEPPNPPL